MKLNDLQQALRTANPAAVLACSPRVVDRVIQQVLNIPSVLWTVPHRHAFVINRHELFRIVGQEELIIDSDQLLPSTVILMAPPQGDDLFLQNPALLLTYWRRLFHASIDMILEIRSQEGRLDSTAIRERIELIGPAEFEEIRCVLVEDRYLVAGASELAVYREFAALYLELRYFAPHLLPSHFPGVRDFTRIDTLLAHDLDADNLFESARLPEAPAPGTHLDTGAEEALDFYWKLMRAADRAAELGNTVRAAITRTKAARVAPVALTLNTRAQAEAHIHRLVDRLRGALLLSDTEVIAWAKVLPALLDKADQGDHPVEAALLFDLQLVCVDHEREIYTLDVIEWVMSGFQRPIKRPLPGQRLVRITKHLRKAVQKLAQARLSDSDRQDLGELLQSSLRASEHRLRERFRPILQGALHDVELRPTNAPEQTAFNKVVEELLDNISANGFITFGDLRDALSRNQLKLPDFDDPQDFVRGDPLLRLDRRLSTLLDGVYRPSEFYTRWLERLTALNFGTQTGRMLAHFVFMPFGGAALLIYGLGAVIDGIRTLPGQGRDFLRRLGESAQKKPDSPEIHLHGTMQSLGFTDPWLDPALVIVFGVFFLALMRIPVFRLRCQQAMLGMSRILRQVLLHFPAWAIQAAGLPYLVNTWPFQLSFRYLLKPALAVAILYLWRPETIGTFPGMVITFLMASFLINSRPGEAVSDILVKTAAGLYETLRAGLLIGLYRFVVYLFKKIMDTLEYVLFLVDEWLRYRSGEGKTSLVARTVLSVLWYPIGYFTRLYIVVLIEPMINPIKLPVSILAAKLVYPLIIILGVYEKMTGVLTPIMGEFLSVAFTASTLWLLPDAFGFLFWEIKENWRLFAANRPKNVHSVSVGSHGETVQMLLHPGFHSGTIPRLFTRLRRAEQAADRTGNWRASRAAREALSEVEEAMRRFVERELIVMVEQDPSWQEEGLEVGRVTLSINRIRIQLIHPRYPEKPAWLEFEDRSAWLLACLREPGWTGQLPTAQHRVLNRTLANLYKLAGVDLVREQIRSCLPWLATHYDLTDEHLLLYSDYQTADPTQTLARGPRSGPIVWYDLLKLAGALEPRPVKGGSVDGWPVLQIEMLVFDRIALPWNDWVRSWQPEGTGQEIPAEVTAVLSVPLANYPPVRERSTTALSMSAGQETFEQARELPHKTSENERIDETISHSSGEQPTHGSTEEASLGNGESKPEASNPPPGTHHTESVEAKQRDENDNKMQE